MVQHHLPVPEAMVLPVEAMEAFLSHNRLDSRAQKAVERGGKRRLASLRSALDRKSTRLNSSH
jgi:phosphoenolpyruvate synthase/pyruvate phosphate dikinase